MFSSFSKLNLTRNDDLIFEEVAWLHLGQPEPDFIKPLDQVLEQ